MNSNEQFIEAIKTGDAEQVRTLLNANPDLANAKGEDGTSAILVAVYWGKRDIKKIILAHKPALTIFEAAAVGDEQTVMTHLKAQPDLLDAYSHDGFTPLQLGAFFSQAGVVKLLIARGANVNAVSHNPMQLIALHSSSASNHIPITKLLLASGSHVNAKQSGGFTPIHAAAQNGNADMLQLLLEWGADPSTKTDEGKTARDLAFASQHEHVLALL